MRKHSVVFLVAALISSALVQTSHAASPSKGAVCTKAGSIQGLPSRRFICMKSGKKLVWAPYVATSASPTKQTAVAPAPTPTVAKFTAKIPFSLPVSPASSITFENAVANFAKIPEVAYSNVQAAIAAGPDGPVNVLLSIGPKTNTTQDVILNGIKRELKLFTGFTVPTKTQAIAYSASDTAWAEAEWLNVAAKYPFTNDPKHYISRVTDSCEMQGGKPVNCGGGYTFMVPGSDAKFIFYGVENGDFWTASPSDYQTATQVNHEFTHAVQDAQFEGVKVHAGDNVITDTVHRAMPCWFSEGQANALGLSIFIPNFSTYQTVRDRTVTNRLNPNQQNPLADYSAESLTKFLVDQRPATGANTPGCYTPGTGLYQQGYYVGLAATEALIAIGGPQATMALIAKGAEGLTWAESFQAVYGIPWSKGADVLGQVLSAEYAAKPQQK